MLGRKRSLKQPTTVGAPTLIEAWGELQPNEFALWLRLCAEPRGSMLNGRKQLAESLGYSYRQFNAIIRALSRKGYVSTVKEGQLTQILIQKKGLLTSSSEGFIRIY